jgi:plastocyanin
MSKKKRRGQQQRSEEPAQDAAALGAEEQEARREAQREEWRREKERKDKAGGGNRILYAAGAVALVAVVAIGGFVLLAGGGGGDDDDSGEQVVVDPRIGNAEPTMTFTVVADDEGQNVNSTFDPTTLTAPAGEVIEIILDNQGSVHHNLNVVGLDGEQGTLDDWSTPASVAAGESASVLVKIDEPGSYLYWCSLHPDQQRGTLLLTG